VAGFGYFLAWKSTAYEYSITNVIFPSRGRGSFTEHKSSASGIHSGGMCKFGLNGAQGTSRTELCRRSRCNRFIHEAGNVGCELTGRLSPFCKHMAAMVGFRCWASRSTKHLVMALTRAHFIHGRPKKCSHDADDERAEDDQTAHSNLSMS
jgi:hypothetical protein